jgi:DNA repair protein RadD
MLTFTPKSRWWHNVTPHRWQAEALPCVVAELSRGRAPVVAAVMGSGKTRLLSELCAAVRLEDDAVVVVSTPRVRLVRQIAAELEARLGAACVGQWHAASKTLPHDLRAVVTSNASLATLAAALDDYGLKVALWIADECHGTNAPQVLEAAGALGDPPRVGFSATPYRADEDERLELYNTVAYTYGPEEALRDGVVVPWEVWGAAQLPAHIRPRGGDPEALTLALVERAVILKVVPLIVDASSIADAEDYAEELCSKSIRAAAIHSGYDEADQERLLGLLQQGKLDVLVHVSLLTEGVNLPWVRGVALRVPQGSRVRFAQYVGRALRRAKGKSKAVLLDPLGQLERHRLTYEAALWECDEDDEHQEASPQDALRAEACEVLRELRKTPLKLAPHLNMDGRVGYLLRQRRLDPALGGRVEEWRAAGLIQEAWEAAERGATQKTTAALRRLLGG